MSDEPKRKKVGWAGWLGLALMVLLIYVLSIGPVYWLNWKLSVPYRSMRAIDETIYKPIWWANDRCPPFHSFVRWYVAFWGRLAS